MMDTSNATTKGSNYLKIFSSYFQALNQNHKQGLLASWQFHKLIYVPTSHQYNFYFSASLKLLLSFHVAVSSWSQQETADNPRLLGFFILLKFLRQHTNLLGSTKKNHSWNFFMVCISFFRVSRKLFLRSTILDLTEMMVYLLVIMLSDVL